jgi:type II secretory pathway component GspD/PulD (secretin)
VGAAAALLSPEDQRNDGAVRLSNKGGETMKKTTQGVLGAVLLAVGASGLAMGAEAGAVAVPETKVSLRIQSMSLGDALNQFGQQTGLHVVLFSELASGIRTPVIQGTYNPTQALSRMLEGTGLTFKYLDGQTIAVLPKDSPAKPIASGFQGGGDIHLAQAG